MAHAKLEVIFEAGVGGYEVNEWLCGRSLSGIAGSNPIGGMDVLLL
jgi:hypothetical protein